MYFKQVTPTKAIMAKSRSAIIARRIFSTLFACLTLLATLGFEHWTYSQVVMWSSVALLSWHALFSRRQITLDLESQQITTKISSLYSLAQQVIPIRDIAALQLRPRISQANDYGHSFDLLIVMHTQVEPLKFEYGNLTQMQQLGEQLAAFLKVPFLGE
jgi:hypothetical protein